jgi:hypothetical protein
MKKYNVDVKWLGRIFSEMPCCRNVHWWLLEIKGIQGQERQMVMNEDNHQGGIELG